MDFDVTKLQTVALLQPRTNRAEEWVTKNLDSSMRYNGAVVVYCRDLREIAREAAKAGLEVSST